MESVPTQFLLAVRSCFLLLPGKLSVRHHSDYARFYEIKNLRHVSCPVCRALYSSYFKLHVLRLRSLTQSLTYVSSWDSLSCRLPATRLFRV